MSEHTSIEWTNSTWNPWRGCDKVSPGCARCYMFTAQRRYGRDPSVVTRAAAGTFFAPLRSRKWARARDEATASTGRHLVFTCSWSDWFHDLADEWRPAAWEIIRQTPESTYQILTKRPERALEHFRDDWGDGYPNVWLGVSIENRRFVDRADVLRTIPATVRFISAEPLLGPLLMPHGQVGDPGVVLPGRGWRDGYDGPEVDLDGIGWLISGGESGPGHRPFDARWALDLRDACAATGVAFLHKQNGGLHAKAGGRELYGCTYDAMPEAVAA